MQVGPKKQNSLCMPRKKEDGFNRILQIKKFMTYSKKKTWMIISTRCLFGFFSFGREKAAEVVHASSEANRFNKIYCDVANQPGSNSHSFFRKELIENHVDKTFTKRD